MADLFGSDLGDRIIGTNGDDFIVTLFPNTLVRAGRGDDEIFGAGGRDRIFGGPGADIINSGAGPDVVRGGTGDDGITGYQDDDRLFGNSGNDELFGEWGNDVIDGGIGDDYITGFHGSDRLTGGIGRDYLIGDTGRDFLSGGAGADYLSGGTGNDVLLGGSGADFISMDGGCDLMNAGTGNDEIYLGSSVGTANGGAGDDYLRYDGAGGNALDFTLAPADGGLTLRGIETIDISANGGIVFTLNADVIRFNSPSDPVLRIIGAHDDSRIVLTDTGWTSGIETDGSLKLTNDGVVLLVSGDAEIVQSGEFAATAAARIDAGEMYYAPLVVEGAPDTAPFHADLSMTLE